MIKQDNQHTNTIKMNKSVVFIISIFLLIGFTVKGQNNMNQEVKVVKPYEPVINDAFKISELPKIVDTIKVTPTFNYEISPSMYTTKFEPKPIKPAKLVSEPLPELYYMYLKAGFGSYLSPLVQVLAGSQRSEVWNWNAIFDYNSSNGKIKNEQGEKVYAGLSKITINSQAKRFLKDNKVIAANLNYGNLTNYYYGYNPKMVQYLPDSVEVPLKKEQIENQVVNYFNMGGKIYTNYLDSTRMNYRIAANYQLLRTKDAIGEDILHLDSYLSYLFDKQFLGVDLAIDYYKTKNIKDSMNSAIVKFSPWVGAFGRKWRVNVGVKTFYDQADETYRLYPRISMQYNIIDYFLIPYAEVGGGYKVNTYKDIYLENPFIISDLGVKPTDNRLSFDIGFRGNISSKIAFNIKAEWTDISNQYFYVNDTNSLLQNKFAVVYDHTQRSRFLGEISYKTNEKLQLGLKGSYFIYNMTDELKPWHMPNYNISFSARYSLDDKIIAKANIFALGKRYAREYDAQNEIFAKELQGVIDINLGLEYRFSKIFSAFADLNNLGAMRYYKWNNYPTQRFNIMLGITYAL
jgi:hypothetical protein